MPASDCCTVPHKRRQSLRMRRLHLAFVVGIAMVVAFVAAPPVPVERGAAVTIDRPRPVEPPAVEYLPARLPAPSTPAGAWVDTF